MNADEITDAFADVGSTFEPISGAPDDDDVERLRRTIVETLQSFNFYGAKDNLSGIVDSDAVYRKRFDHTFDRMEDIAAKDYDDTIPADAKPNEVRRLEALFKAKKARAALVSTAERATKQFILSAVESTWVAELEDPDTYYNGVTARELLQHLADNSDGLEDVDGVEISLALPGYWDETPSVPEYIIKMQKAQRKARRTELPITDEYLAGIATRSLRAAQAFPTERAKWDSLAKDKRTWAAWKTTFLEAHEAKKRFERATKARGAAFGSANAATEKQPGPAGKQLEDEGGDIPATNGGILGQLDAFANNIAAAATTSHEVTEQLVANVSTLTATNAKQHETLEALRARDAKAPTYAAAAGGGHRLTPAQEKRLIQALKKGWCIGGFCSTHGHGVSRGHTSASCTKQAPGHVTTATRANPAGPGAMINKGWDDGL